MSRNALLLPLLTLLTLTCLPARETMEDRAGGINEVIQVQLDRFMRYVSEGQADSIASLYADNAHFMPPNEPAAVGRDAIRRWMEGTLAMGSWELTLTSEALAVSGPMAVERGRYILEFTPGPDTPPEMPAMADTGKYLVHWHQTDTTWVIVDDIFNSNRPAAGTGGE